MVFLTRRQSLIDHRLRELDVLMLEFDDIQYILLTRVPALTGRYEFLSFQQPAQGRAWLDAIGRRYLPIAPGEVPVMKPGLPAQEFFP